MSRINVKKFRILSQLAFCVISLWTISCSNAETDEPNDIDFYQEPDPEIIIKKCFWQDHCTFSWIELETFIKDNGEKEKTFTIYYAADHGHKSNPDSIICDKSAHGGRIESRKVYNDFNIITINDKTNPDWTKIKLLHKPSGTEVVMYDFSQWKVGQDVTFNGFRISGSEVIPIQWTEKFISEYKIDIGYSYSSREISAFLNEDGEARMMYVGVLTGKYGPIPIIYDNEPQPDERTVLSINGICSQYINPNYKELITDMKYIYDDGYDWRPYLPNEMAWYLYDLYGWPPID